jgi:hypothetical protein
MSVGDYIEISILGAAIVITLGLCFFEQMRRKRLNRLAEENLPSYDESQSEPPSYPEVNLGFLEPAPARVRLDRL